MNSNWSELTRPKNGVYRLSNEDLIVDDSDVIHKANTVGKQTIADDFENDLLELMERIAREFLALAKEEVIESKRKMAEYLKEDLAIY